MRRSHRPATVRAAAIAAILLCSAMSLSAQSGPPLEVTMHGTRVDPLDQLRFPDTAVGRTSPEFEFTVRNVGLSDLTLPKQGGVTISDGDGASFVITQAPPTELPIQGRVRFSVAFKPASFGEASATVTIHVDSPDYPTFSFEVAGNAIAPSAQ
ncbi:Ig-like domain-containing protein [Salinispira pacifica]